VHDVSCYTLGLTFILDLPTPNVGTMVVVEMLLLLLLLMLLLLSTKHILEDVSELSFYADSVEAQEDEEQY
jgi:hypothetical protein